MDERDERDDAMNESAARAARLLRAEVPMRAEWREALLSRIDADERTGQRLERSNGRWTIHPMLAIAAGLILMLVGAAGAALLARASGRHTAAATMPATAATVRFVYVAPGAAHVSVVGDFNQWNPVALPLRRLNDGTWIADVPLTPGRYAYAFVVDGKLEADPTAPRATDTDFGVANSIIMVRGS